MLQVLWRLMIPTSSRMLTGFVLRLKRCGTCISMRVPPGRCCSLVAYFNSS